MKTQKGSESKRKKQICRIIVVKQLVNLSGEQLKALKGCLRMIDLSNALAASGILHMKLSTNV